MAATRPKHSKLDAIQINQGLTILHPDPDEPRKSPADEPSVDIVAVPGLGANPEWTWKNRNKVDWLRDTNMLARTIPTARIMMFEYESQWFGKGAIDQRLSNVADQLVQALFHSRPRGSPRPIIFVCHCLGGIVVEKVGFSTWSIICKLLAKENNEALLTAKLRQNDYPNIFMSVVGCIFLGTPFRGTKSQTKASLLAEMAQTVGLGTNSGLVKLLEEGSEVLRDLLDDFVALAKEANMRLFCFFEQHESDMMRLISKNSLLKHKEIIVEADSATIPGVIKGSLASDHFELNKFNGPKDGRYISVSGEISTTVQKARVILKSRQNAVRQALIDDGTYQTFLDDLKVTDPKKDMDDSVRGRPASQASWVLSNENYMKWKKGSASQVLWIHGSAGKGQAVIASSFVTDLTQEIKKDDSMFLSYFFCDEKDSHRRDTIDLLKLLIRQMILRKRDLTEHLLVDQRKGKKGDQGTQNFDTTSVSALCNTLQNMLRDPLVGTAYFIVNALDETLGESRQELLKFLTLFMGAQANDESDADESTIKWILLSRSGRPDIEKGLQQALIIDMEDKENVSHVNDAVKAEISGQVDQLAKKKNYNAALSYFIKRHIYSRAEGNYIYVNLVIQELKNLETTQISNSSIRKVLEGFPYGLTDMFEHIRRRVLDPRSEGIEYTKEIFRTLVVARRAPTISELALIADLPLKDRNDEVALKRYITRCGAFVTIPENTYETVEWIDVAAKEHLETYAKDQLSLSLIDVQHGIIALRCLDYVRGNFLGQSVVEDGNQPVQDQQEPEQEDLTGEYQHESNGAIEKNADETSNEVENREGQNQGDQNRFDQASTRQNEPYQQEFQPSDYQNQGHHGQDYQGWNHPAHGDSGQLYNPQSSSFQSYPQQGYTSPPPGHPSDGYQSPPHTYYSQNNPTQTFENQAFPAQEGHEGLEYYAGGEIHNQEHLDVSGQTGEGDQGDPDQKETDENDQQAPALSSAGDTAPSEAPEEIIQLLEYPREYWLEHAKLAPVDVVAEFDLGDEFWSENSRSRVAWWKTYAESTGFGEMTDVTPLHIAAISGFSALVDYILEQGGTDDINKVDSWGFRPFYWACQNDDIYIVQRLFKAGTDVNARRVNDNVTALWGAASKGHADIVQYLLDQGAEVDVPDETYGTPLYTAAENGYISVIRLLLEHRANINLPGGLHRRSLNAAAYNGHVEVVQLLLEKGAEVDPEEEYRYGSALGAAARKGHDGIARLLLQRGWNVYRKIGIYGSALVAAATYGHAEVVQSLLEHDTNVISRERALEVASKNGKADVVKKILEKSYHLRHQKAFLHAASYGRDDVLELLQTRGTNQDMLDTALYEASDHEHESTVGLLIKFGANPGAEGVEYGTALTAAAYDGSDGIVQILLEHNADVNKQGGNYGTALQAAAFCGDLGITQKLLDHGAHVNTEAIGIYGSALQAACYSGSEDVVELLLKYGADVNARGGQYSHPIIAAADECHANIVELLIKHGADVNVKGYEDNAPILVLAGYTMPKDTIEILLDHGAMIDAADDRGNTALIATANSGDTEGLELFITRGANIHAFGDEYGAALHAAASEGDEACCQLLLNNGADFNQQCGPWSTPLQAAAWAADLDCIKMLLDASADVNLGGGDYGSALQAAAYSGDLECLQTLLSAGADIHQEGGDYGCALQAAALSGNLEGLRALLEGGADVNQEGGMYQTALQAAVFKYGNQDCVNLLLDHGANVLAESGLYGSIMQAAAAGNNLSMWDTLLQHGADVHRVGGKYGNALQAAALKAEDGFVQRLLQHSVEVNELGGKYGTALQAAAYANKPEVVIMLLEHHADFHLVGGLYGNALNAAACKGNTRVVSLLLDRSLPDYMLDQGLLQAVYHRQAAVVEMLLKNGANVQTRDDVLGSVLDAIQKELVEDPNSDEENDQYEDEYSNDEDEDENEEEADDADNAVADVPDNDASVASLQLEDSSTEESKILKILEDAMAKVKRNPDLQRFRSVRPKAVPAYYHGGQAAEPVNTDQTQYPHYGSVTNPVETSHTPYDNHWQAPEPANINNYGHSQTTGPAQGGGPAYSSYQSYSNIGSAPSPTNLQPYSSAGQLPHGAQDHSTSSHTPASHPENSQPYHSTSGYTAAPSGSNYQQYPSAAQPQNPQPYSTATTTHTPPPRSSFQQYPGTSPPPPPPPAPPSTLQAYASPGQSPAPGTYQAYQPPTPPAPPQVHDNRPAQTSPPPPPPPQGGGDSADFARLQAKVSKFSSKVSKFWE